MKPIRSDIAWSTPDRINIRGLSLPDEILGHFNLGDFAYLNLTGVRPTPQQSAVFNAIVVTLVEHGVTPSALVARMTYAGAPESLQAAVAAGLCGLGTVFVGTMEGATKLLYEVLPQDTPTPDDLAPLARDVVARFRSQKRAIPGIGHPVHKPVDPRTPRLFEIAEENGLAGRYVALMQLVQQEAERASGKVLPLNATGAIGAICCELGFPEQVIRGFGVMARAIGLVAHIMEEARNPMALEVWRRAEEEASRHIRPA
ncbi:MAG: citryl-CoA lyase [Bosea sp.]|uniref:citryl-CoA lyase n=1 Tax=Bosea sp. (in: a-proteobacteria) TaxID=1871050 RepID=UPI0010F78071|nr:citryl-CoA lyase [Bosea sp. (in: a-proteobacteria)]MCP4734842.1 citryl-CoA lyase [Bosea sp. (in: a-proteobacteria)]